MRWQAPALPWVLFALLAALTALLYQQGVGGPWIFDDFPNLAPLLAQREGGWTLLIDQYLLSPSGLFGRPVAMLSFMFSAMLSGENLAGWKQFNVFIHLLTAAALFWVGRRLFQDLAGWTASQARYAGLLIATLWLLHPLHVSTVLYTVQRMTILSALFCALAMGLYLSGRHELQLTGKGWLRICAAMFLCWPLAILSKENGVLLGIYLFLIELILVPLQAENQRRKLYQLLAAAVGLPLLLGLLVLALEPGWIIGGYGGRDFSLYERLLTQSRVVWGYLSWVLLPMPQQLGFMHDDVLLSTGLLSPLSTLVALLGWVILLLVIWCLRRRLPLVSFGLAFFIASQLLESSIIPLELVFEHRTYLGSFGLLLAIGSAIGAGVKHFALRAVMASAAVLLLALLCLFRVQTWSDINSLYTAMWRAHPQSPRLITTFAAQFARNGQFDYALQALDQSVDRRTEVARLYVYCLRDAELSDSVLSSTAVQPVKQPTDYYLSALAAVSLLGLEGACRYSDAQYAALLDRVLDAGKLSRVERHKLLISKAQHQYRLGELRAALQSLDKASNKFAQSPTPLSLQIEWLAKAGQSGLARRKYQQLKQLLEATGRGDFALRMIELEGLLQASEQAD